MRDDMACARAEDIGREGRGQYAGEEQGIRRPEGQPDLPEVHALEKEEKKAQREDDAQAEPEAGASAQRISGANFFLFKGLMGTKDSTTMPGQSATATPGDRQISEPAAGWRRSL